MTFNGFIDGSVCLRKIRNWLKFWGNIFFFHFLLDSKFLGSKRSKNLIEIFVWLAFGSLFKPDKDLFCQFKIHNLKRFPIQLFCRCWKWWREFEKIPWFVFSLRNWWISTLLSFFLLQIYFFSHSVILVYKPLIFTHSICVYRWNSNRVIL